MIKNQDLEIAREFKSRLQAQIPLLEMRLFGSRARGDGDPDSDLDIFVEVVEYSREIRNLIDDVAWEVGFEHLLHISPLVFSRKDLENTPLRSSPIVRSIMNEGVRI